MTVILVLLTFASFLLIDHFYSRRHAVLPVAQTPKLETAPRLAQSLVGGFWCLKNFVSTRGTPGRSAKALAWFEWGWMIFCIQVGRKSRPHRVTTINETEEFVLDDGETHACAKLILSQDGYGRCEEVPGIQLVVAQELPERPMQSIGAGARHCREDRTCVIAVLRAIGIGDQLELLKRIGRWVVQAGVIVRARKSHAVQLIVRLILAGTIYVDEVTSPVSPGKRSRIAGRGYAGKQARELQWVSAVQRQFGDAPLLYYVSTSGRYGVHQRYRSLHLDSAPKHFLPACNRNAGVLVELQHNAGLANRF